MCTYKTALLNAELVAREEQLDSMITQEVNCWFYERYGELIDNPDLEAEMAEDIRKYIYSREGWMPEGLYMQPAEHQQLVELWWAYRHPDGMPF